MRILGPHDVLESIEERQMKVPANLIDEAIVWHIRLRESDASSQEWEAFTAWLSADSQHAAAYDAVTRADSDLEGLAGPDELPDNISMWRWSMPALATLAMAASILLAVLFWPSADPAFEILETAPGARRMITLDDGSRIELNGGTRLAVVPRNSRFARLDRGEALFSVRHDSHTPFEVAVGDIRLIDRGTIFNVSALDDRLSIDVAEGSVLFRGYGRDVGLNAGQSLRVTGPGAQWERRQIEPAAVTDWRDGRLVYRNETMATVAGDLGRALGKTVRVEQGARAMTFSGVIILRPDDTVLMTEVAALTGLRSRRVDDGWLLSLDNP